MTHRESLKKPRRSQLPRPENCPDRIVLGHKPFRQSHGLKESWTDTTARTHAIIDARTCASIVHRTSEA
jgi:hypothetical protein